MPASYGVSAAAPKKVPWPSEASARLNVNLTLSVFSEAIATPKASSGDLPLASSVDWLGGSLAPWSSWTERETSWSVTTHKPAIVITPSQSVTMTKLTMSSYRTKSRESRTNPQWLMLGCWGGLSRWVGLIVLILWLKMRLMTWFRLEWVKEGSAEGSLTVTRRDRSWSSMEQSQLPLRLPSIHSLWQTIGAGIRKWLRSQ